MKVGDLVKFNILRVTPMWKWKDIDCGVFEKPLMPLVVTESRNQAVFKNGACFQLDADGPARTSSYERFQSA